MSATNFIKNPSGRFKPVKKLSTSDAREQAEALREGIRYHDRLLEAGVQVTPMPKRDEQPLAGKTFVLTGALESLTRDQAKDRIEVLGGRATSSVSGETDYLVAGADPGSKLDRAREEGVEILDEDALLKMIDSSP